MQHCCINQNYIYLCGVNRLVNYLISYLLLLCISATIIPLNLLHHHEEETHCDIENAAFENDPCHISSYHANDFQKPHCEHKSHLNKEQNQCELCEFIISHRYTYIANKEYRGVTNLYPKPQTLFQNSSVTDSFSKVIFSRGPPSLV